MDATLTGVSMQARLRAWARYAPMALLVLVTAVFAAGNENFLTPYNITTILTYAVPLLFVALGQMSAILIGGTDLSVGGTISFVSVCFVTLLPRIGVWAYPAGVALGLIVGWVNGVLLTRVRIPSFIATLGTGGVLMSLAMLVAPVPVNVPSAQQGLLAPFTAIVFGVDSSLIVGLVLFVAGYVLLRYTPAGRALYYVGSNIRMCWTSGVDIVRSRNFAFMLSGLGAALAGITLSATQFGCNPYLGAPYVLTSIASVVVGGTALTGGTGGPLHTLFGALMMSVLQNGMTVVGVDQYFQQSILGLMIIACVALTFDRSKVSVIK